MRGHGKIFIAFFSLLLSHAAMAQMGGASRTPFLSSVNSTTTPLASGATFTGEWEQCFHWSTISVAVTTDLDGTLKMQFSPDGTNLDSSLTYDIQQGVIEAPHKLEIFRRYCRVTFTNDGATTQSYLRLQTIYGQKAIPMAPMNLTIGQDQDAMVGRVITEEISIAEGLFAGYSIIRKFGRNPSVASNEVPEDVWAGGGLYTGFPATVSELVEVVSSSASDDDGGAGCEVVSVQGLDTDGNFQSENVTLDGQTPVDTANIYLRLNRMICVESNNGANDAFNVGTITARLTTTTATVFATMPAGSGQTQVGCYTIPAGLTGYIRNIYVAPRRNNSVFMDGAVWVRNSGAAPRLIRNFSASNGEAYNDKIFGGVELSALTDVCIRITDTSATAGVTTHFDIVLVKD